ncbi:topoisomerase [Agrobacterium tumefaciens]|nr:topoisomerase [Agrobacterium tumefaciens]NTE22221.1 topoisomerase [Agrobacterium tumefaciens]
MAKRDPNKTARNKTIEQIKEQLRDIQTQACNEVDREDELSLNAYIGSKAGDFMDLKNEVIKTPDEYIIKWIEGLEKGLKEGKQGKFVKIYEHLKDKNNQFFKQYVELFLRRSFLKRIDEFSKKRPHDSDSEIWYGEKNSDYGLLITPRFVNGKWENDKSEIRAFPEAYWTIGHVLRTGICMQGQERRITFSNVSDYLNFTMAQVRLTNSKYQIALYESYIKFVEDSDNPSKIPLLIPEVQFSPESKKHLHRLDFLIINPFTLDKIGIELSPWSTHGEFSGTDSGGKKRTIKEMNYEAKVKVEKDVEKVKAYFKKKNVVTLTYMDTSLADMEQVFADVSRFLNPNNPPTQLSMHLIDDYFGGNKL